jgi:hypothetical protein
MFMYTNIVTSAQGKCSKRSNEWEVQWKLGLKITIQSFWSHLPQIVIQKRLAAHHKNAQVKTMGAWRLKLCPRRHCRDFVSVYLTEYLLKTA